MPNRRLLVYFRDKVYLIGCKALTASSGFKTGTCGYVTEACGYKAEAYGYSLVLIKT